MIFFWMVCLALNSIAQRSGRVLGTKCRHQAILRSSPIVCGFDAMDMLISWAAHAYSPTTPRPRIRHGASKVLLQRFIDNEGTPDIHKVGQPLTVRVQMLSSSLIVRSRDLVLRSTRAPQTACWKRFSNQ
ncbi:hypothetical protein BJX66DRAFT_320448 [Aspergillus keveii]|uniref:Secreted protein n=1 Tax=Aspergillus keveii TaxID=714993 RepID=A0ABR4FH24_9EURO